MERQVLTILLALGVMLISLEMMSVFYWEHSLCLSILIGLSCYPVFRGHFADGKIDVFEPIYLFISLYGFFFIVRPIYLLTTKSTTTLLGVFLDRRTLSLALLASTLGLLAFEIGYYWARHRTFAPSTVFNQPFEPQRIRSIAWVFIAVGVVAYLYVIFVLGGGWEATFNTERTARYYISAKNPYVANLTMLVGAGMITLSFLVIRGEKNKFQWYLFFALVLGYGALEITYSGSRRFLINLLFAVLLQRHYLRKRFKIRGTLPMIALLLIFSASWLYIRSTMHEGADAVRDRLALVQVDQVIDDMNTQGDNVIFDYLVAIINSVPHTYDYNYGKGLLRFLYFPIPRQLWVDKPENINRQMTQRYDPLAYLNGASAGTSLVGEWFLEFGWMGIVPGALLLGFLLGTSYRWLLLNVKTQTAVLLYSCGLFAFIAALVRGGLFGAATELAQLTLPILLMLKFARPKRVMAQPWQSPYWTAAQPPQQLPYSYSRD